MDWKPFEHPQLGAVEIGGWMPGFRLNPPDDEVEGLVEKQAEFVTALAGMLPRLVVEGPHVERLGERLWRVRVAAVNEGGMATRTAMGVRARRLAPTRWELEVPPERVVSGDRVRSSASVAGSGGRIEAEWVVVGEAGGEVRLRLVSPEAGEREVVVRLEETVSPAGEKREER